MMFIVCSVSVGIRIAVNAQHYFVFDFDFDFDAAVGPWDLDLTKISYLIVWLV